MASLSEHHEKIQAAIDAAKGAGYWVSATTCCCGEGLIIEEPFEGGCDLEFDLD
jgi:hypothetical protein